MIVIISDRATASLAEIGRYIGREDPTRSVTFVEELLDACEELQAFPRAYPSDPRFGPDARRRTYGNYHIIYEVLETRIVVLTIVHAARDPHAFP